MNSIAQTTVLLPKSAQFRLIFQVTQPWFRVWLPNAGLKSHWRSARVWLGVGAVGGFAVLLMMMAACAAVLAVALTSVVTIMRDMGWLMCWDVIDLTWLRRHTLKGLRAAHAQHEWMLTKQLYMLLLAMSMHITRALEQTEEFQPVSTTPCRVIIGLTNYSVGLLPRLTNVPRQICTAINAKRWVIVWCNMERRELQAIGLYASTSTFRSI